MPTGFEFVRRLQRVSDKDAPHMRAHFLDVAQSFDPDHMEDHHFFPLEMTWFHGEPVWEAMAPEQRLRLNRLSFCQSYFSTAVAEAATNVLNYEAALRTLIQSDPDVALYMAREVVEETTHIESFLIVIRKILSHYGLAFDDLRAANPSLELAARFVMAHSLLGWLRRDFLFYYFTRFPLNVNQKTVERCTIAEPKMHPVVRTLLKNHAIDEARHMQMSRATGKAALVAMRSRTARNLACLAYARFAAGLFIGRHARDGARQRETRIRTLELCGVPRERARQAYFQWRDRVNQREDPPLVRAGRHYYLKQNLSYVDELDVSVRMRAYMKRVIGRAYADAAAPAPGMTPLEFDELKRAS